MARWIWQGDFAGCWFGAERDNGGRPEKDAAEPEPAATAPQGPAREPLGIVERDRRARREKWALKAPDQG